MRTYYNTSRLLLTKLYRRYGVYNVHTLTELALEVNSPLTATIKNDLGDFLKCETEVHGRHFVYFTLDAFNEGKWLCTS